MEPTAQAVSRALTLELIDATGAVWELAAELEYDAADPFAVAAVFHTGPHPIRWVFARDLLAEGMFAPTGEGDVEVWPSLDNKGRAMAVVELRSPHGQVLLQTATGAVVDFLQQTFSLLPRGAEHRKLDVDGTVLRLLEQDCAAAEHPGSTAA